MKKKKTDLRVRRTLRVIRRAYFELVLTKNYEDISITELTELAEINRKTFYLHYNSLDELTDEVQAEIAMNIVETLKQEADTLDVAGCIRRFYYYMEECHPVEKRLLCDPEYSFFYDKVTEYILSSDLFDRFYRNEKYPDIVRAFCVAITSIYRSWLDIGKTIPLDDLIDYASKLLLTGYNGVRDERITQENPAPPGFRNLMGKDLDSGITL